MRTLHCFLLFLSGLSLIYEEDQPGKAPTPTIRFPDFQPSPQPTPPGPVGVPVLTADQLYVIDSDVDCMVLSSPEGLVSVAVEQGPVRIRGRFVDGPGRIETRNYKGKWVFTVDAVAKGRVELLVIPVGAKTQAEVIRKTLDVMVGALPQPPPPGPTPPPVDPVNKAAKLAVVLIVDPATQSPDQGKLILSQGYRKIVTATGGGVELLDTKDPAYKANGYEAYARLIGSVPFVMVFDAAATGPSVPLDFFKLPTTEKELEDRIGRAVKK